MKTFQSRLNLNEKDKLVYQSKRLKSMLLIVSLFAGFTLFILGYSPHANAFSFRSSLLEMFIFSLIFSIASFFYLSWILTLTRFRRLLIIDKQKNSAYTPSKFIDENVYEKYILPHGSLNLDAYWDISRPTKPPQNLD